MKRQKGDLTPAQEAFCLGFLETNNQSEAYRRAYPKSLKWKDQSVWINASKTMKLAHVSQRISELQEKTAKKLEITLEEGVKNYRKLIKYGMEIGQNEAGSLVMRDPGIAHKATDSLMKLGGFFIEKIQNDNKLVITIHGGNFERMKKNIDSSGEVPIDAE